MIYDVQKASFLKRISALILDFILLLIVATGAALLISVITDYDGHAKNYENKKTFYEEKYSEESVKAEHNVTNPEFKVDFDISESAYKELTQEEINLINVAYEEFRKDEVVIKEYNLMFSLMLMITSLGIFVAYLILEFILPLILKNGQTVGKKIFGIAVMHTNCVKVNHLAMFARSVLGKYTIETMIPVIMALMIYFGVWGFGGTAILLLYFAVQVVILCVSKNNSCIHDLISGTVAVDLSSQMIFESEEKMLEYKKEQHAKKVEKSVY